MHIFLAGHSVEALEGNLALDTDMAEVYYEEGVLMKDGAVLDLRRPKGAVCGVQVNFRAKVVCSVS